jgi:hypothetical protein
MSIPTEVPTPQELELPRTRLSGLIHDLTVDLMHHQADLLRAYDAAEFATTILRTADRLAEANERWAAMSSTIRESWGM